MNPLAFEITAQKGRCSIAFDSVMRMVTTGVASLTWCIALRSLGSSWEHVRVELAFATVELRRICESRRRATAVIGATAAHELAQRLADLSALATVADLADLFASDIIDRSQSERAVRLEAGYNLVFRAGHVEVPLTKDGATDWSWVSRIRITALESRHG